MNASLNEIPAQSLRTDLRHPQVRTAVEELLTVLVPKRRLRSFPRAVKPKMSNYQLKRAAHRAWPQPTMSSAQAVDVLPPIPPATTCRSP